MKKNVGHPKGRLDQDEDNKSDGPMGERYPRSLGGGAEAEDSAREGKAISVGEKEENNTARNFHSTVLSGNLRQAVSWETDREGFEGFSFRMTAAQITGDRLQRFSGRSTYVTPPPP